MSNGVEVVLQDLINEVIADAKGLCNQAVVSASNIAMKEMSAESDRLLGLYYSSYKPKRYKRTHQLKNALTASTRVRPSTTHISAVVGIEWDPSVLSYHAHMNHGMPFDPEWVFDHFLKGEHPNVVGNNGPNYESDMVKFRDALADKMGSYIMNELTNKVGKRLIK